VNFTFSKAYLLTYSSDDNKKYKGLRLYYVYKDNSILGQYFRHGNEHFFSCQDQKIQIQSTEKWYKRAQYTIINDQNSQPIGEFIVPQFYNDSFNHYPEVPYTNPYLKIMLLGAEYEFRREKPEINYWLPDSKTWGHYCFAIYNKQNVPVVDYSFKIENPLLDGSISFDNALDGKIEAEEEHVLLVFTGFFLMELFFDDQNRSG
jgi:hypothetical protein